MKFARVRLQFPAEPVLPVQAALADADGVDLVQLRFGGVSTTGPRTYVMSVVGDPTALAAALTDTPEVVDHEVVDSESSTRANGAGGIVYVRAAADPLELKLHGLFSRGSLVMTTPVDLYPDGSSVFRVLGEADDLRTAVAEADDLLQVTVERVGEYDGPPERVAAGLTDRQTEVVRTALDLGYYDVPREATHEDVAAALDCAPATASEHLQKAERALMRSVFE
ncbi:MAG: helix-turn-helix domain-containing protein [Halosimplex sp.]